MDPQSAGPAYRWVDLLRFVINSAQEALPERPWQVGISSVDGEKAVFLSGDGWRLITREPGGWVARTPADKEIFAVFEGDLHSVQDSQEPDLMHNDDAEFPDFGY